MKLNGIAAACLVALAPGGCAALAGTAARRDSAAAGGTAPTPAAVSFAQADLDGDAKITRREFELWQRNSGANDAFDAADTNLNGVLTLDEWQAMTAGPPAPLFRKRTAPRRPR